MNSRSLWLSLFGAWVVGFFAIGLFTHSIPTLYATALVWVPVALLVIVQALIWIIKGYQIVLARWRGRPPPRFD